MAHVYRFDDAVNLPQPTPADFTQELAYTREHLSTLWQEGLVSGAVIFGSAIAKPSSTSDIDIMVSTPEVNHTMALGIQRMTRTVHERSGIQTDITCFSDEELAAGEHIINIHTLRWIGIVAARYPENVIGANPVPKTKPRETDVLKDIDGLLANYRHNFYRTFMEGHVPDPEPALHYLLNFPHRAGRETLGALIVSERLPLDVLKDADKSSIMAAIKRAYGPLDPEIGPLYDGLVDRVHQYEQLLDSVRQGTTSREQYNKSLHDLIYDGLAPATLLAQRLRQAYRTLAGLDS